MKFDDGDLREFSIVLTSIRPLATKFLTYGAAFAGSAKDADADTHVRYIRDWWGQLEPATDGYYTVDTSDESRAVRHANYQGNFPRLLALKKKYDPTNLFRLNANINPAG